MRELIKKYLVPGFLFIVLCLLIVAVVYLVKVIQEKENLENQVKSQQKQNQQNQLPAENLFATSSEQLKIGEVGEVKVKDQGAGEEKPLVTSVMPAVITSTVGKITAIKDDRIILMGQGTNFADMQAREVAGIITDQTITFDKKYIRYQGKDGLKILKVGLNVLVEGEGNIRGKTEFVLKTINIVD